MLGGLLTSAGSELIEKVGGIIDDVVTTKEEKLQVKSEFKKMVLNAEAQAANNVTARWEADMTSDNKLSKNIRPVALIFLTVVFVFITFFDGNVGQFTLDDAYKPIYQTLLLTVYGAYFAGRTYEKSHAVNNNVSVYDKIDMEMELTDEDFNKKPTRRRRRRAARAAEAAE